MGNPINPNLGLNVKIDATSQKLVEEARKAAVAMRELETGIVDQFGRRAPILDELANREKKLASLAQARAAIEKESAREEIAAVRAVTKAQQDRGQIIDRIAKAETNAYRTEAAFRKGVSADEARAYIENARIASAQRIAAERAVTAAQKADAAGRAVLAKAETAAYIEHFKRYGVVAGEVHNTMNRGLVIMTRYAGAFRPIAYAMNNQLGYLSSLVVGSGRLITTTEGLTSALVGLKAVMLGIAGAAALGVAGLVYASHRAAEYQVTIARSAAATGATVQQMSGLNLAAKQMGVDLQTVERSLIFLSRGLGEGDAAGERFRATLNSLGVRTRDAHGRLLAFSEILPPIIDRLGKADAGSKTLAATMNIMSRSTTEQGANLVVLLRVIARMPGGLQAWIDKAKELGLEVTPESSRTALEYKFALTELTAAFDGLVTQIGRRVIPTMTTLMLTVRSSGLLWSGYKWDLAATALLFVSLAESATAAAYAMAGMVEMAVEYGTAAKHHYTMAGEAADKAAEFSAKYEASLSANASTLRTFAQIVQATSGQHLPDFGKAVTGVADRLGQLIQKYKDELDALNEIGTKREAILRSYEAELRAIDAALDSLVRHHKATSADIIKADEARELASAVHTAKLVALWKEEEVALDRLVEKYKDEIAAHTEGTSAREAARKSYEAELRTIDKTWGELERTGKLTTDAMAKLAEARQLAYTNYQLNIIDIEKKEAEHLQTYIRTLREQTAEDEARAAFKEGDFIEAARLQAQKVEDTVRAESEIQKALALSGSHYELYAQIVEESQRRISAAWQRAGSTVAAEVARHAKESEKLANREEDTINRLSAPRITSQIRQAYVIMARAKRDYVSIFDIERLKIQQANIAYRQNIITVMEWSRAVIAASNAVKRAKQMEQEAWRAAMESTVASIVGIIAGIRAEAAIKAIFEVAEGIAAAARHDYKAAALHFLAATEYGLVAGGVGQGGRTGAGGGGGGGYSKGSELNPSELTPEQQQALLASGTLSPYERARNLQKPIVVIEAHVMGQPNHAAYVAGLLNDHTTTRGGMLIASKTITPSPVSKGGRP